MGLLSTVNPQYLRSDDLQSPNNFVHHVWHLIALAISEASIISEL